MKFTVKSVKSDSGMRVDSFLSSKITALSRSKIRKMIELGYLSENGIILKDPAKKIKGEEVFELEFNEQQDEQLKPELIPLDIIYEDEHIIVINKSPGISVHPGAGNVEHTIVNALLARFANFAESFEDKSRPGIVHRLDKDTSGCLIVAKNEKVKEILSKKFSSRQVEKTYLAITYGIPPEENGLIETFFGRHPVVRHKMAVLKESERKAITEYKVLKDFFYKSQKCALVELNIKTGRTHQIRVHMAHIKSPVLGDRVYGGRQGLDIPRQMLHAWKIKLEHPILAKKMTFKSSIPYDMRGILAYSDSSLSSDNAFEISG